MTVNPQATEAPQVTINSTPTATICQNCGATNTLNGEGKCSNCQQTRTLESYGFSIRPATKGGGLLLFNQEEPIDQIKDSDTWLNQTATEHKIPVNTLKKAILKAKAAPKKAQDINKSNVQIVTEDLKYIAPDSGIINGKPYLGLWLPCEVPVGEENIKRENIYFLLFSDGSLIQGNPQTLAENGLNLTTLPFEAKLRISKKVWLQLSTAPKVNPSELFQKIVEVLKQNIEFHDERYYPLTTYWIIGTYFHKQFSAYPYLFLNAVKNSGKTKLMMLLSLLCYNGKLSTNMSNASLFRHTQNNGATILLDEADQIAKERLQDLENLLNAGYKRGAATVDRTEPRADGTYRPTEYDVYSPKAVANIRGLNNSVLESRTIGIIMKRGLNKQITDRDISSEDPIWQQLRDELSLFYFQNCLGIAEAYKQLENFDSVISVVSAVSADILDPPEKKTLYSNRVLECWKPLFAVAKYILEVEQDSANLSSVPLGNSTNNTNYTNYITEAYEQLLSVSIDLVTEQKVDDNDGPGEASLLMGMLEIVTEDKMYTVQELIDAANKYMDSAPDWFNTKWTGKALKRLGFNDKRRCGKGMKYRLTPESVKDMAKRLGVELPEAEKQELPKTPQAQTSPSQIPTQEQVQQTYNLIHGILKSKYDGNIPIAAIPNNAALQLLLKDGKIFSIDNEHVGVN
ncbi:hypothetical protein GX563_08480 [Candidatus Bathyarchaeota archaeon]|nr:hypothetical protein [Candidatus Bathyarchaeota archaeon]